MQKIPVRHIKKVRKEPELSESFMIRDIGEMLSGKDMLQELHRHDFFLLLALKKGRGEHIIDFIRYPVNDHSVFFMRPGQVHQLVLKKESQGFLIQFSAGFYSPREVLKQIFRRVSNKNYCSIEPVRFNKLQSILKDIFHEYTTKQENYTAVINAQLEIFFIELARQSEDPKRISKSSNEYAQLQLEHFLELLQTHLATKKKVADYARLMHLSPYQLNSITKSTVGKTCSAIIDEQIVLEGKRNLLATSNQVNQIADELGYEDVSYFIRFFKKHTGYSPETFRKNFK